jgi:hypothetical protein
LLPGSPKRFKPLKLKTIDPQARSSGKQRYCVSI